MLAYSLSFLLVVLFAWASAQTPISVIQTAKDTQDRLTPKADIYFGRDVPLQHFIDIDSDILYQEIIGFGGAFTEAAAYTFSLMSKEKQDEILQAYFSPSGLNYTVCRVHMNSCDFSLSSYSCDDTENDYELNNFNIEHDKKWLIPMIKGALNVTSTYKRGLKIYLSPWSPPAWMKKNGKMDGSATPNGLINSTQILSSWALFYSKFMAAYQKENISFWGLTIQNESEFAAPWEACVYTPEFQRDFIKYYLGPQIEKDFPGTKIMIYDHNRDHVVKWAKTILSDLLASQYVSGTAFHWYSDGDYEHLTQVYEEFPNHFLLSTESCNCPGVKFGDWPRGESYAKDIIQDLNNYASGWVDWNMVLNPQGGPNHLNNYCDAPVIADSDKQTVYYQPTYYYMGHFSKFLTPGSKRTAMKKYLPRYVDATSFKTPEGKIVIIVQNTSDEEKQFKVGDNKLGQYAVVLMPARSIATFIYQN